MKCLSSAAKACLVCLCLLQYSGHLQAGLVDPLRLQDALQMANDPQHFALLDAEAQLSQARADYIQSEASMGLRAELRLEAAYIEPSPIALDQSSNDSEASLRLTKPLLDFSGSDEKIDAAELQLEAMQAHMDYQLGRRKLDIAERFFQVILADLKYAWDNEAMSMGFVRFAAAQDRYALAQVSEIELLEAENRYQDMLHSRRISEINQRQTRAALAEVLNTPSELPSNLITPSFDFNKVKIAQYKELLQQLLAQNPQIQLAEKQLQAAELRLKGEQKQLYPTLQAELEVSEYARESGSNEQWRAQLNLSIPLYENQQMKSDIARARASLLKRRATSLALKAQIRQQALQLWQNIELLKKRREQLKTLQIFRELNLDRNRALYEMEVSTDLGNAMVAISEVRYKQAQNDFQLVLAWMQLQLLSGQLSEMDKLIL